MTEERASRLEAFVVEYQKMRKLQRAYFKTRSQAALQQSMAQERKLDNEADALTCQRAMFNG